jgi:hypothetical protein
VVVLRIKKKRIKKYWLSLVPKFGARLNCIKMASTAVKN